MPLADFACLSKKCAKKKGEAPVYELPLKAIACPACGSRKIKRLFNKVNVNLGARARERYDGRHTSSSMAARVDAIAEGPYNEAMAKADTLKAASAANIKATRDKFPLIHVVPSSKLQSTMAGIFPNTPLPAPAPPGQARKSTADLGLVTAAPSMRESTAVTARDTEHKLGRKPDGTLEIKKA